MLSQRPMRKEENFETNLLDLNKTKYVVLQFKLLDVLAFFQNEIKTLLQIYIKMEDMKPCDNKQQINQENLKLGGHDQQQDQDVIDSMTKLFLQLWSSGKQATLNLECKDGELL